MKKQVDTGLHIHTQSFEVDCEMKPRLWVLYRDMTLD